MMGVYIWNDGSSQEKTLGAERLFRAQCLANGGVQVSQKEHMPSHSMKSART